MNTLWPHIDDKISGERKMNSNLLTDANYKELIDLVQKENPNNKMLETLRAKLSFTKNEADFLIALFIKSRDGVRAAISEHNKYPSGANHKAANEMNQVYLEEKREIILRIHNSTTK